MGLPGQHRIHGIHPGCEWGGVTCEIYLKTRDHPEYKLSNIQVAQNIRIRGDIQEKKLFVKYM